MDKYLSDGSRAAKGMFVIIVEECGNNPKGALTTILATTSEEAEEYGMVLYTPKIVLCNLTGTVHAKPVREHVDCLIQATEEDILRYSEGRTS
jgi:hypothetical protein